ncbi:MAG: hypothetical protein J5819_00120 [Eubacterium sp.]|nr:hypothetical protein [Eubacterium sp.]
MKHENDLKVNKCYPNVWLSPDGNFYNGYAHESCAEDILECIYEITDVDWPGDTLEALGWVRASSGLMWDYRIRSGYWEGKELTQRQYAALIDWCSHHGKRFIEIDDTVQW